MFLCCSNPVCGTKCRAAVISPDKARKGVIYPLKRTFTRWLGFLSVHLRVLFLSKGVRYAQIKISARTFHSLVSFAHKNWCTLATLFKSACVTINKIINSYVYVHSVYKIVTVYFPFCVVLLICCCFLAIARVKLALKIAFYFYGSLPIKRTC